jgi:hypothetical protein
MSKANLFRILILYIVSIVPTAIICLLILIFPLIETALKGPIAEDWSAPGAGLLLMVYGMISGLVGLVGALPFALFVEYLLLQRTHDKDDSSHQTTFALGFRRSFHNIGDDLGSE